MPKLLVRTCLAYLFRLPLVTALLLGACSTPETVDTGFITAARYTLNDIRYFIAQGDRVDTTTRQLQGSSVQNPSTILATQQVEEGFGGLVKTSRFSLDPTSQVPAEVDLRKFEVSVPTHWYGNDLFERSVDTYLLSPMDQQKPYGFDPNRMVTIQIPASSKLDISRQITAYQLTCSFEGILANTTTGQRYRLSGKWTGLLQYANPVMSLKASAL